MCCLDPKERSWKCYSDGGGGGMWCGVTLTCCKIFIFLNNTKRMLNYMKNLCINVNLTQNVNFYHYLQKS